MDESCAFCRRRVTEGAGREVHHSIPKFLYKYFPCGGNPDLYRIVLCSKCHGEWTDEWNRLRITMKRRLDG